MAHARRHGRIFVAAKADDAADPAEGGGRHRPQLRRPSTTARGRRDEAQAGAHRPLGSVRRLDAVGLDALAVRAVRVPVRASSSRRRSTPATCNAKYDVLVFCPTAPCPSAAAAGAAAAASAAQPAAERHPGGFRDRLGAITRGEDGAAAQEVRRGRRHDRRRRAARRRSARRSACRSAITWSSGGRTARRAAAAREVLRAGSILAGRGRQHPPARLRHGRSSVDVFFDNSPVFALQPNAALEGVRPVAWFDTPTPLRSGWAWGQAYLTGRVAAVEAPVGKGTVLPVRARDHVPRPAARHVQVPLQRHLLLDRASLGRRRPRHRAVATRAPTAAPAFEPARRPRSKAPAIRRHPPSHRRKPGSAARDRAPTALLSADSTDARGTTVASMRVTSQLNLEDLPMFRMSRSAGLVSVLLSPQACWLRLRRADRPALHRDRRRGRVLRRAALAQPRAEARRALDRRRRQRRAALRVLLRRHGRRPVEDDRRRHDVERRHRRPDHQLVGWRGRRRAVQPRRRLHRHRRERASAATSRQGDGVYKSTDAGKTWTHIGLEDAQNIAKIRVHPTNPDIVYVAAFGHHAAPNAERGIFRIEGRRQDLGEDALPRRQDRRASRSCFDPNNPQVALRGALGGVPQRVHDVERRPGQRPLQVDRRRRSLDRDLAQPRPAEGRPRQDRHRRLAAPTATASTRRSRRRTAASSCPTTRARRGRR